MMNLIIIISEHLTSYYDHNDDDNDESDYDNDDDMIMAIIVKLNIEILCDIAIILEIKIEYDFGNMDKWQKVQRKTCVLNLYLTKTQTFTSTHKCGVKKVAQKVQTFCTKIFHR